MEVWKEFLQNKWTDYNTKLHILGYSHVKYISMRTIKDQKGPRMENGSVIDDFFFNVVLRNRSQDKHNY